MKKILFILTALFAFAVSAFCQGPEVVKDSFLDVLAENWAVVLTATLVFAEAIVKITPSEKDNSILNFIKKILDFVLPNIRKGGGEHS